MQHLIERAISTDTGESKVHSRTEDLARVLQYLEELGVIRPARRAQLADKN